MAGTATFAGTSLAYPRYAAVPAYPQQVYAPPTAVAPAPLRPTVAVARVPTAVPGRAVYTMLGQPSFSQPTYSARPVQCAPLPSAASGANMPGGGGVSQGTSSTTTRRQFMNPKSFMLMYNFKGDFKINGRPLLLTVDPPNAAKLATGLRIWDGGIVLAKYLEVYAPQLSQRLGRPLRGIELGCGTGVAGFGLAFLGHEVLLTDIGEEQAAATQGNIAQNQATLNAVGGRAQYGHLDWRTLPERSRYGRFDMVLGSDVIWHESLVEPFLQAVAWATSGPGAEEVILSHKARDQESIDLFHKMLGPLGLRLAKEVPSEEVLGEHGHPDVKLYHLQRATTTPGAK